MASKWLEERWEVLMPVLEVLGCAQEEQIKSICEAELALWRQRPSLRQANSLRKPLTETRNRIREASRSQRRTGGSIQNRTSLSTWRSNI